MHTSLCAFKYYLHNAFRIVCLYIAHPFLCFSHFLFPLKRLSLFLQNVFFPLVTDFTYLALKTRSELSLPSSMCHKYPYLIPHALYKVYFILHIYQIHLYPLSTGIALDVPFLSFFFPTKIL